MLKVGRLGVGGGGIAPLGAARDTILAVYKWAWRMDSECAEDEGDVGGD